MKISPEQLGKLSYKWEAFMELELGMRLPYISLIYAPEGGLGFFTNRTSNKEIEQILQAALEAIRTERRWISLEGEVVGELPIPEQPKQPHAAE
jgi:hypothetical protein